jgi:hypothetical protein
MNNHIRHTVFTALALFVIVACSTASQSPDSKIEWSNDMQKMAKDVRDLIPFLYDRGAFHDSKNHDKIEVSLKNFSEHVHKITPKMGEAVLGDDPLVSFSLESLEGDLKRSYQAFELGHLEYARTVAKSSLNHCFRCHSVAQGGATAQWDLHDLSQLPLNPVEKADLLVATRKYDQALQFMEQILSSQEFLANNPFDFESMLRRYLALVTRIQKDPARALGEIDRVSAYPDLPRYLNEQVRGWRISLINWIHEDKTEIKGKGKKRKHKSPPPLEQAKKEMDRAVQLQQFPQDHAGDVEYLRATVSLHESLKKHLKPQEEAEAFYLLGRAYEVLDELGSWNLHETYFEACVRKAPHTGWAKMCYSRYEESVLQGYSGSSGTHIPAYESDKLKSLKELL